MHIGLIGGIGPAATIFYYQQIVAAFSKLDRPLHLTIAHASAQTLSRNVSTGQTVEQAREFKRLADELALAGAATVVITSMGGHFCVKDFEPISPLPIINGPSAVAEYIRQKQIKNIGVLGTRIVMETGLYGALSGVNVVCPSDQNISQVNDDYVSVAISGSATQAQRERLLSAGKSLVRDQGAEAILLGGTDLNIVYKDVALDFPVIDSAKVHVDNIVTLATAS